MNKRHLQKYMEKDNKYNLLTHNPLLLLSPRFGHGNYGNVLKKQIENEESVILHIFSASSWYVASNVIHDKQINHKIKGIVLESNPYYFDEKQIVKASKEHNKLLRIVPDVIATNGIKSYIHMNGGTDQWKNEYFEKLSSINIPTLVIGSEEDRIVPHHHTMNMYENIKYGDKELFISKKGAHCQIIRSSQRDKYFDKLNNFYNHIS